MNKLKNKLTSYLIIAILGIVLIGGGLYFKSKYGLTDAERNAKLLSEAQLKVSTEKAKLESLKKRHEAEQAVIAKLQREYSNIRNVVLKETDIFFENPKSSNPKIKLKIGNKKTEEDINKRRAEITKRLNAWEEKNRILESDNISIDVLILLPDLIKSAQDDLQFIKRYMAELDEIVNDLNPNESNFSLVQLNTLRSIVEENAQQIEQSIVAVAQIETETQQIYAQIAAETGASVPTTTGSVTTVVPPIVTTAQIQTQQQIVTQAEQQQAAIEQVINPNATSTEVINPEDYLPVQVIIPNPYIIRYLPPTNIDYTGWPDLTRDSESSDSLLLEGANR